MSIPSSYASGSIGGSNNAMGDMKYKLEGFSQTKNADNLVTRISYQGTKERLENELYNNVAWKIGTNDLMWGQLESIDIQQDNGVFWSAVLNYNKVLDDGSDIPASALGPQHSSLDISMYSVPIQKHPNYDYRWNHYLFGTRDSNYSYYNGDSAVTIDTWYSFLEEAFVPAFQSQLGKTYAQLTAAYGPNWINSPNIKFTAQMGQYISNWAGAGYYYPSLDVVWGKDMNERPRQGRYVYDYSEDGITIQDRYVVPYQVLIEAQKPGIEFFDLPTYQITQSGRYKDKTKCNWCLRKGGLIAYPQMGDYGIQKYVHPGNLTCPLSALKGYWLCEGGNIQFDGKYYNATCKYTWDILDEGWDQDVYLFYNSRKYYQDQSKANPNSIMGNATLSTTVWDRNQWE